MTSSLRFILRQPVFPESKSNCFDAMRQIPCPIGFSTHFQIFRPKMLSIRVPLSTMRGTLIGNIFCKLSTTTCQSSASILASGMSDHFPCFISLPNVKPSITRTTIYSTDYSPTALAKFKEEINKANLSDLVQPAPMSDRNISYNNLDQVLLKAKALHIPIKQVKFDKKKHKKSPWITKGIIKSLTCRDKLYQSFKQ